MMAEESAISFTIPESPTIGFGSYLVLLKALDNIIRMLLKLLRDLCLLDRMEYMRIIILVVILFLSTSLTDGWIKPCQEISTTPVQNHQNSTVWEDFMFAVTKMLSIPLR